MQISRPRRFFVMALGMSASLVFCGGCGTGGAKDRLLPFKPDPLGEARGLISGYAAGQPVGSEVEGFADLVAGVAEAAPEKAVRLKEFLDAVSKSGRVKPADARELLTDF